MFAFTYHRASGLRQATTWLNKGEAPRLLAGAQTLLPTMKQRLAAPKNLIDLSRIDGLSGVELRGRSLVIGALTSHHDVATSPVVQQNLPALAQLASMIGDPAGRYVGTIGGPGAPHHPHASRYALVGGFVAKRPSEIRVAVTGAGASGVFRVPSFEEALKKRFSPKSLEGLTVSADGLARR